MRYLFSAPSTYGFLFPSIGVAREIARRGHAVAFATDVSMEPVLASAGFERIARGTNDGPSFRIEFAGHPAESVRQVRHLARAVEQFRPDVLVGTELAHGTVIAGELHQIPTAMIGLGAYLWACDATARIGSSRLREWVRRRHLSWVRSLELARRGLGLPERHDDSGNPMLGDAYFLRSVPELEGAEEMEMLPAQVQAVGPCLWSNDREDPELDRWLAESAASGEPIVYAQMGRFFEKPGFWPDLVNAFAHRGIRLAISVGRMDRPADGAPANFFVRAHVPQERVLPHARAAVCTSTTTPVMGALSHGLPLLLIPGGGGGEQDDLLRRCVRAGVGRAITATEATPDAIREAVEELLRDDSPYLRNARALRAALGRAGGIPLVADHLEHLGREGTAILREPSASPQAAAPPAGR